MLIKISRYDNDVDVLYQKNSTDILSAKFIHETTMLLFCTKSSETQVTTCLTFNTDSMFHFL